MFYDKTPRTVERAVADAAIAAVFDWIFSDPKHLGEIAFGNHDFTLQVRLNAATYRPDKKHPPLSILITDETGRVHKCYDPIKEVMADPFGEEDAEEVCRRIGSVITALQSGIDRLKAHEVKLRKAQP